LIILEQLIALLVERKLISESDVTALFDDVRDKLAEDGRFGSRSASDVVKIMVENLGR